MFLNNLKLSEMGYTYFLDFFMLLLHFYFQKRLHLTNVSRQNRVTNKYSIQFSEDFNLYF